MLSFACLLVLLLTGVARAGEPPSLAVLPLEKAAASAQYDGLGRALSGMLVSDLATLPGLRLVERERLDALLAEMKLGETGFLDPKTAQKLGKGVGARYVVTGSWSVIDPAFVLDARIVEVQSGEIVKAAAADGTMGDFVAVEKELVEGLVAGLDLTLTSAERRKLMVQAPTEKFGALAAYGKGLAREREGRLGEAKQAFELALAEDPGFADAQAALGALSATLAAAKAEQAGAQSAIADARYAAVLAEIPDMRKRPPGALGVDALAGFGLRLGVLESLGRECDRYAEMRAYAERVGWRISEPPGRKPDGGVYGFVLYQEAKARGIDVPIGEVTAETPEHLRAPIPTRVAGLFRTTTSFLLAEHTIWKRSHGLVDALLACRADPGALAELDAVIAGVRASGAENEQADAYGLPLGVALELVWLQTRAGRFGADAELTRRTTTLLARVKGDTKLEPVVVRALGDVEGLAKKWDDHRARTRGLSHDEITRRMRVLADAKAGGTPVCAALSNVTRQPLVGWLDYLPKAVARGDERYYEGAYTVWAPASDLGCLPGVPARAKTAEEAWAFLDAARTRALPEAAGTNCPSTWAAYDAVVAGNRAQRGDATLGPMWLAQGWSVWSTLVHNRCARE